MLPNMGAVPGFRMKEDDPQEQDDASVIVLGNSDSTISFLRLLFIGNLRNTSNAFSVSLQLIKERTGSVACNPCSSHKRHAHWGLRLVHHN